MRGVPIGKSYLKCAGDPVGFPAISFYGLFERPASLEQIKEERKWQDFKAR